MNKFIDYRYLRYLGTNSDERNVSNCIKRIIDLHEDRIEIDHVSPFVEIDAEKITENCNCTLEVVQRFLYSLIGSSKYIKIRMKTEDLNYKTEQKCLYITSASK